MRANTDIAGCTSSRRYNITANINSNAINGGAEPNCAPTFQLR